MKSVVKANYLIQSKALNHWQFQQFLLGIQSEDGDVVYHNDVRWLGRGFALHRLFNWRRLDIFCLKSTTDGRTVWQQICLFWLT